MTAKEYLSQLAEIDDDINDRLEECRAIREMAEKITPSYDFSGHGSNVSDKVGNGAINLADLKTEILLEVDKLVAIKKQARRLISAVPDKRYRKILYKKYIKRESLTQIAEKMNYSYKQTCRLHGKALSEIVVPQCP